MNLLEYTESYISNAFDDVKDMTHKFNQLDLEDRKDFLEELKSFDKVDYDDFIEKIRKQAVLDFWTEERELIKQGKCTRDWTAEQIEYIMNISTKSGDASINGGKAIVLDKNGNPVMKIHDGKLINEVYEGHHMLNVHDHPEYAGDYRNIQALARSNGEHLAAHGGNYHNETDQYYDVDYHNETGQYNGTNEGLSEIDNTNGEVDFDKFWKSKKKKCIFKSDADMENLYDNFDKLTDGEKLALKNADLALENGDFEKFKAANDLAEKYQSKDFYDKIGLETDANIKKKYGILSDCDNAEVVKQYQFYEYASRHGYDLDVTVYVDENGKVIATSLDKDYVPKDTDYKISMKESIELSEEELKQYIDNAKDTQTDGESINDNNDSDSENQEKKDSVDEEVKDYSDAETNGAEAKDADDNTEKTDDVDDTNEDTKDSTDTTTKNVEERTADATTDSSDATNNNDTVSGSGTPQGGGDEVQDVDGNGSNDTEISDAEDNMSNDFDGADTSDVTDTTNKNDAGSNADGSSKNNTDTIVALPGGDDTTDSKVTDGTNNDVTDTNRSDANNSTTTDIVDTSNGNSTSTDSSYSTDGKTVFDSGKGWDVDLEISEETKSVISAIESLTGKVFDLDASSLKTLNNCIGLANKGGDIFDIADWVVVGFEIYEKLKNGDINGAKKALSDQCLSSLASMLTGSMAAWIVGIFAVDPVLGLAFIFAMGYAGDQLGRDVSDILAQIFGLYDQAGAYTYPVDPLILDLDGDGIETVAVEDGVNFDFDNNGFAEKTGWVGADDGLLVRDIDGNGQIDNGSELFGDMTSMEEAVASHGFEALQQFDTNQDNVINQMDAIYSELRVWKDANQNGQVDEGELLTLEELGIAGLNLVYEDIEVRDENGNSHSQASTYMNADGSIGIMEDVWFAKDASDTVVDSTMDDTVLAETEAIGKLPDIMGRGNQYSLHQAMLRDETGTLQQMVEAYIAEADEKARKAMIPDIVYMWTGVADVASGSRGVYIDARKLEALEVISGREFESVYGENPVQGAGQLLDRAFDNLVDMYYALLEQQTTFADLYTNLYLNFDVDEDANLFFDTQELAQSLTEGYRADNWSNKKTAVHFIDNLMKTGMIRYVKEEVFYQQLSVFSPDILHEVAYMGDDACRGTSGDDVINGEMGDDFLVDGKGNDTYYIEIGDGQDTISDGSGMDRILYGEGILPEDIKVVRKGDALYLTNVLSGDSIEILNFFASEKCGIEQIEFADGTLWTTEDIWDRARYHYGTEADDRIYAHHVKSEIGYEDNIIFGGIGNDAISGAAGDDFLYGEAGDDILQGWNGSDVLAGGIGNDTLQGSAGDDTYIVNLNDGKDTIYDDGGFDRIVFGEGILAEHIKVTRHCDNLCLTNTISGDCLTVTNYFSSEKHNLEWIEFADGTTWNVADIQERARYYYGTEADDNISAHDNNKGTSREDDYIYGGAGNDVLRGNSGQDMLAGEDGDDTLFGGSGADVLAGGTGDDILHGGSGNDTYRIELGAGNDSITEESGTDCLVFGEGIFAEDMEVTKSSYNLLLTDQTSGVCITVKDFFRAEKYYIEQVQFADGSVWTAEQLLKYVQQNTTANMNESRETSYVYGETGDESLQGSAESDYLVGKTGNDKLSGKAGADLYFFELGDGQDTIYEESGMDRIVFGEGIEAADIVVSRNQKDLYLTNQITGDQIVMNAFFTNSNFFVETVEFADGTIWSAEDLMKKARYYHGSEADETISTYNEAYGLGIEDDYLYGYGGNDTLFGNMGQDELYGASGNDILNGGIGDDYLSGGMDSDTLYGGAGADTYSFHLGDGQDVIQEESGTDRIVFGEGVNASDILVSSNETDLFLINKTNGDKVQISSFFVNSTHQVETVEFADGTTWTVEQLLDKARYYYGNEAGERISAYDRPYSIGMVDDYLYGQEGNDTLFGNMGQDKMDGASGDDTLHGGTGDDYLSGGTGNDTLRGGSHDDVYVFQPGDGQDTIYDESGIDRIMFGEGVKASDIVVSRNQTDLYLTNQITGDRITITSFFVDYSYFIDTVEFADGTIWTTEDMFQKARHYYGSDGDDTIVAYDKRYEVGYEDDFLYGGAGNDRLVGGAGDDTYIFNIGDGSDTIIDKNGTNRIILNGVLEDDIVVEECNGEWRINSPGNSILLSNFTETDSYLIEFADGTVWDMETLLEKVRHVGYASAVSCTSSTTTRLGVMIQFMASFEDGTGMMQEDISIIPTEQNNDIANQWWTKEVV